MLIVAVMPLATVGVIMSISDANDPRNRIEVAMTSRRLRLFGRWHPSRLAHVAMSDFALALRFSRELDRKFVNLDGRKEKSRRD